MRLPKRLAFVTCLAIALSSCARAPVKTAEEAMRKTSAPALSDDLPLEPLLQGVATQIEFLKKSAGSSEFIFGPARFSREEYLASLEKFVAAGRAATSPQAFFEWVLNEFDFYEVYGRDGWGEIFMTSYYEPMIPGSLKPTARFSQPLYRKPDDLVALDLGTFDPRLAEWRKLRGRISNGALVPYFSREDIDVRSSLKGRKLEICWVDPIDAFFLQVQGSGTVELADGRKIRVNYAEKNGHTYESVSRFLKAKIAPQEVNLHTTEAYLRSLPRNEMQAYLNMNPSYVFFRESEESALTYLGLPAVDGRTIATDARLFPKGALGFVILEKPVFENTEQLVPARYEPGARFVLDQDIGGAITGGGRVDLFWGRGPDAKLHAGAVKNPGKLYYLAPKRGN